jgi:hypothetical protein
MNETETITIIIITGILLFSICIPICCAFITISNSSEKINLINN